ncbi:MAG: hypothetical protein FJX66_16195 [Alphaproteobacteria bacterium]|nr:hypothetical protein [Alphaproteobacteria bacterium]
MRFAALAAALAAIFGVSFAAAAQDIGQPVAFTDLLRQGFEVKAVTYMPPNSIDNVRGQMITTASIMVTVQRSDIVAVCIVPPEVWAYQGKLLDNQWSCQTMARFN